MRHPVPTGTPVVVKVGSSSLSGPGGGLDTSSVERVVEQIIALSKRGNPPVLVTSGSIAAGFPALGMTERPTDIAELQVAAAIGQTRLVESYASRFAKSGIAVAQVLLTKDVLGNRAQYLNARAALERMLSLGVIPVVNENDTVVVDELKLGDNDQLAAITAHLVSAGMLVILTDTEGLYTDDPRFAADAKLLSAVEHSDVVLDRIRRTTGAGDLGSGGVATKVAAARMAAFSGIPTVIASAYALDVVEAAVSGEEIGTWIDPRADSLAARKLWIAFGLPAAGRITVDDGAIDAIRNSGGSLLAVGLTGVSGDFSRGDAIEVFDDSQSLVAKGISRFGSDILAEVAGHHSDVIGGEVIHRDDLVVLV
ncbi:MAG: glutamate 5-kinase [Acidimicrobiia bacterium]|nr:MAG: glutamate 5-kinase [Acidimicrobiia bacterium]